MRGRPLSPGKGARWLSAAAVALLALLVALLRAPGAARTGPPASAAVARVPPAPPAAVAGLGYVRMDPEAAPEAAPEPPGAPAEGSARAFLAGWYGARWPALERAMEAAGAALDSPYEFTPWEQVAPEFERSFRLTAAELDAMVELKLDWPAELTVEWLRESFPTGRPYPLRAEDLPLVEERVAPLNDELRARARAFAELVEVLVAERFARDEVLRAPFTTLGLGRELGFWSRSTGGHGWAVTLTLKREDYPEAVALEQELQALRRRRHEAVVRYLHGTIGR